MKNMFFSLRPKHWIKNLFIFLPLVFGKKLFMFWVDVKVVFAFLIFSLAMAAVYLANDIMDLEEDREHPVKSKRPLAAGLISLPEAMTAAALCGVLSVVLAFILNVYFGLTVLASIALNLIYTKWLKRMVIVDVFCIGAFFLLRVIAGCFAADVKMSHWIAFMAFLLALFLGFVKRREELKLYQKTNCKTRCVLNKYNAYFIDHMITVVTSSIVIVYMLYTVDINTISHFGNRHLIYTIPFVYYGIFRYFYLVYRHGEGEDPVSILFSDDKMRINLALWVIVCIAVIYFKI